MLKGKKILIGICGGIAAYKICTLVRLLKKAEAEVKVIMTPSAVHFVSPLTLSSLSGNDVVINMYPDKSGNTDSVTAGTWHVHLGLWADLFIIAPATLSTISKTVNGITDNFLLTTLFSARCKTVFAPAMDHDMYLNRVTQSNIEKLIDLGYLVIPPEEGELASGLIGMGRMAEAETIFDFAVNTLSSQKDLSGKKILITAGPTVEYIDKVRYISNPSSGKMGFQLAQAAIDRGADVTLVSGPVQLDTPKNCKRIDVTSSDEMFAAVKNEFANQDLVIMAAAVEDLKPVSMAKEKIKKDKLNDRFSIDFEKSVDILDFLGKNKSDFKLIGFAVETENEIENARRKLETKNLDMIVLNNPDEAGAGFKTDTNIVTIITSTENQKLPLLKKYQVANAILDKFLLLS